MIRERFGALVKKIIHSENCDWPGGPCCVCKMFDIIFLLIRKRCVMVL